MFYRPFSILNFYLAAGFIPPFTISLLFFLFFLLIGRLFKLIQIVVNTNVEFSVIIELMIHIMFSFFPISVPFAVLFATIFCLNKLSNDSEIISMQSFGLSKRDILKPFLMIGLIIALSVFSLSRNLVPHSKTLFKNTVTQLTSKGMFFNIKSKNFFMGIPNVILFAKEVSNHGNDLLGVFIHYKNKDQIERIMMAEKGSIIKQYFSTTQTPMLRLKLEDGNLVKYDKDHKNIEKIFFKSYDFPILEGGQKLGFVTRNGMRSNAALAQHIQDYKVELSKVLSKKALNHVDKQKIHEIKIELSKGEIEYWSRFNTPILCIIFIILGVGLGVKKIRGKEQNTAFIGIMVVIIYYTLFFLSVSIAKKGYIPSWFAIFSPTLLAGFMAVKYYRNIDWQR